jgi:hypothetical protein
LKRTTDPQEVDPDGVLADVDVMDISQSTSKARRKDGGRDLDAFFTPIYDKKGIDGKVRKYRNCKCCEYVFLWTHFIAPISFACRKKKAPVTARVSDTSTLRRHLQLEHKADYHDWCKKKDFVSKLPDDVKQRAEATKEESAPQGRLDGHLRPIDVKERVLPYTDKLFREAAYEWLIATDQVSVVSIQNRPT